MADITDIKSILYTDGIIIKEFEITKKERRVNVRKTYDSIEETIKMWNNRQLKLF